MNENRAKRRLPPLNGLKVFEAVARRRSMSAAARELQMTQGAVSQQVRRLEAYLRLPLFNRGAHGVALTAAGVRLLEGTSQALDSIAGAAESARRAAARDTVVVSTVTSVASWWLLPRLAGFERTNEGPSVRVEVSRELTRFETDAVDVAIRHGRSPWPGLTAQLLFRLRVAVVTGPGGPRGNWLDDSKTRFLCDPRHDYWQAWAARKGIDRARFDARLRWVDDGNVVLNAARDGLGIAVVPMFLIQDELRSGELRLRDPEILDLEGGYWLVHPAQELREPVAKFTAWLAREAAVTESRLDAGIEDLAAPAA